MQTQCKKCVMDISASDIIFNENGCNFCAEAEKQIKNLPNPSDIWEVVDKIKKDGKGKDYDVLVGLSGGVDSSYALHLCNSLGLRPLCFSIDNGWNDPKADENIMRLVETLKVPFYRYTIDIEKFRDLQSAFIKAGQKNLEIPTDHILMASTYEMADKYNIKWVISGGNVATESIMPASWGYNARDLVHIKDVYKKMTGKKLKGLPMCSLLKWNYYRWVKKTKLVYLLDYVDYNRQQAIEVLESIYGWKPYGEKHCENIFTWWFQNYYLFEKFGIDKRKAHLSSLIISGQITREEALSELEKNLVYPELGIEGKLLKYEARPYTDFKTDEKVYNFIRKIVKFFQ